MADNMQPFERKFTDQDLLLFNEIMSGLIGMPLSRVEESYGECLSMDFGELIPKAKARPPVSPLRGTWVISTWGCDINAATDRAPIVREFRDVKEELSGQVGAFVRTISIDPSDLSLSLSLDGGATILMQSTADDDTDQWFILTPFGFSVGAKAYGKWYVQLDT